VRPQSRADDENAAEEWHAYLDINYDLPVFCPECAKREFGNGSPAGSTPV